LAQSADLRQPALNTGWKHLKNMVRSGGAGLPLKGCRAVIPGVAVVMIRYLNQPKDFNNFGFQLSPKFIS
jgi:hypothetical protein